MIKIYDNSSPFPYLKNSSNGLMVTLLSAALAVPALPERFFWINAQVPTFRGTGFPITNFGNDDEKINIGAWVNAGFLTLLFKDGSSLEKLINYMGLRIRFWPWM